MYFTLRIWLAKFFHGLIGNKLEQTLKSTVDVILLEKLQVGNVWLFVSELCYIHILVYESCASNLSLLSKSLFVIYIEIVQFCKWYLFICGIYQWISCPNGW